MTDEATPGETESGEPETPDAAASTDTPSEAPDAAPDSPAAESADETADAPLHRLIAAGETVISHQVLMDARGRKTGGHRGRDCRHKLPA